jgi:predicted DNA-binding transcriptional regulator AlpA
MADNNKTPFLFPVDPEDFWEKIRKILIEELKRIFPLKEEVIYETPGLTKKPIYRAHEVCEMLGISRQTLHEWRKGGVLRAYKIKSRVFYLWSDIERHLPGLNEQ